MVRAILTVCKGVTSHSLKSTPWNEYRIGERFDKTLTTVNSNA